MTPAGLVCSRYRVTPGGRRYSDPPNAPFGISFVTRAVLSERGGWSLAAPAAPPRELDEDARTTHDYAWLLLDEPASVPADTVWPRLRFGDPAGRIGQPILSAGYPAQTPVARSAPGQWSPSLGNWRVRWRRSGLIMSRAVLAHGGSGERAKMVLRPRPAPCPPSAPRASARTGSLYRNGSARGELPRDKRSLGDAFGLTASGSPDVLHPGARVLDAPLAQP